MQMKHIRLVFLLALRTIDASSTISWTMISCGYHNHKRSIFVVQVSHLNSFLEKKLWELKIIKKCTTNIVSLVVVQRFSWNTYCIIYLLLLRCSHGCWWIIFDLFKSYMEDDEEQKNRFRIEFPTFACKHPPPWFSYPFLSSLNWASTEWLSPTWVMYHLLGIGMATSLVKWINLGGLVLPSFDCHDQYK